MDKPWFKYSREIYKRCSKRYKFKLRFRKNKFSKYGEILIAGCGTGQHAITTASKYKDATIYALDLSFNSLAYTKENQWN